MSKIAVITGATSGIGKACAELFASKGYDLILTARRTVLLDTIEKEIETAFPVRVLSLSFDVRDKKQVHQYLSNLPENWRAIDLLINNAGLALDLTPLQDGLTEDWECMIDTNVKGLLYVTRAIAPLMIRNGRGHIVNIGSIAGKEVYPNGNVYCATKHAVDALTKAMRMDMLPYGIRVSQICPGMVETGFSIVRFKGDTQKAAQVYAGITPLTGADIANAVWFMVSVPAHVNINDMVIMPTAQANSVNVFRKEADDQGTV